MAFGKFNKIKKHEENAHINKVKEEDVPADCGYTLPFKEDDSENDDDDSFKSTIWPPSSEQPRMQAPSQPSSYRGRINKIQDDFGSDDDDRNNYEIKPDFK